MTYLYKKAKTGKLVVWGIEHNENSYWTISGDLGGKLTTTAPTVCQPKNVGKTNETTVEQQTESEVESKIKYQIDHGYCYTKEEALKGRFEVTLAAKYVDRKEKNKLQYPYIYQPKLDGLRCYIKLVNGVPHAYSRNHKEYFSIPHILEECGAIKEIFVKHPDVILDGELYNHNLKNDFNKICSLVRKTKLSEEDKELSKKLILFNCFDVYFQNSPNKTYLERNYEVIETVDNWILSWELKEKSTKPIYIRFVTSEGITHPVDALNSTLNSDEEVESKIKEYISKGYEGIMLKRNVPYFFGRTTDLLKYKFFKDEEYEIIDFEEGKGNLTGIAAAVVCRTKAGEEFKAGVTGTQEYARNLFEKRADYKGKLATIKYQELTPVQDGKGGVPRFGKMMSIRDYE